MEVDEALSVVGGLKRWHIAQFLAIGLSSLMPLAGIAMMFVFIAWTPPHHCKVSPGQLVNETIPEMAGQWDQSMSKCTMYVNSSIGNETMACPNGWTYYAEGVDNIITEWDLVCEYNYLAELSETFAMAGALMAEMTVSFMVDKYGRRRMHLAGITLVIIFGSCMAAAPNYIVFLCFRPLASYSLVCLLLPGATLVLELFDSKYRTFAGVGMEFLWSFSYMYIALLGYLVNEWRLLVLILSLTNVVFLFHFCTLPESPRWLTANNRYDEAEEVLQNMARRNNVKVKGRLLKHSSKASVKKADDNGQKLAKTDEYDHSSTPFVPVNSEAEDFPTEKFSDIFKNPILRKHTIVSSLMWFACELVFYGIILTTPSLAGDRYLNFFLGGLVEVPGFITVFLVIGYGRRLLVTISFILSGTLLIVTTFIPPTTAAGASLTPLIVTVSLLGKYFITISFSTVTLYTRELFPTNLRATAVGVCNVLGRVGSMGAPFMAYAAKKLPWLPNIILGSIAVVVGFICLQLPETCDKPLPQKLDDINRLFGKKNEKEKLDIVKSNDHDMNGCDIAKSNQDMNGRSNQC